MEATSCVSNNPLSKQQCMTWLWGIIKLLLSFKLIIMRRGKRDLIESDIFRQIVEQKQFFIDTTREQ